MLPVVKITLGIAFMLGVSKSQNHLNSRYSQLFNYPNKQAARQRLILRDELRRKAKALRKRRGIQTTVSGQVSPTNVSTATTYKQSLDSYVCDNQLHVNQSNGYDTNGYGMRLNVTIFEKGGEWIANISWNRPIEGNDNCIGYRIFWYKPKGTIFDLDYCDKIIDENITSYVIDSSKGWKDLLNLDVAVFPLPSRSENWHVDFRRFQRPTITTSTLNGDRTDYTTSSPSETSSLNGTQRDYTTSSPSKTSSLNGTQRDYTTSSPSKNVVVKSARSLTNYVVATIAVGVAIVAVTIFWAVWWVKRKGRSYVCNNDGGIQMEETYNKTANAHYISYYSDNDKITETAIKIASWLKQQHLNVIMDKFVVITNGKRKWCDRHISMAKKVILIISPGYLKMCKLDENVNPEKEKQFSFKDQLAYNEVCHIRDEITKMPLATQKFVAILVETGYNELPFWIKPLNVYKYSGGIVDKNILEVLNA